MTIPPEQAQFLETRRFSTNEICRLFKVPPHLVGDLEKAMFSNIEHQSIDFVTHSVRPWVARWEQSLQQALIMPCEQDSIFVKFNIDGLLRGDYKAVCRATPQHGKMADCRQTILGSLKT